VQKITLLLADHPFPPHAERWLAGWLIHRRGFDCGGCPVSYSPKLFLRRMPRGHDRVNRLAGLSYISWSPP
jgi:hypothetical protein